MEPDKFSSWKEIAAYLGVDVKTAQRWEKVRGMPVRRIPGGVRGSVYVNRAEIEEWLNRADGRVPERAEAARDSKSGWSRYRGYWRGGLAGAVVLMAIAAILVLGGGGEIASGEVRGQTLTAMDRQGKELWGFELDPGTRPMQPVKGWREAIRTVRWTGASKPELLAATLTEKASGPESRILCFDGRGRKRWQWDAGMPLLDFNGKPFERTWAVMQVLPDDTGGRTVVWAAVANPLRWASGLFRLDAQGEARLQFANAGSIMQVLRLPAGAGSKLLVAGVNNAWSKPFIAEIEADGAPAFSPPSGNDRYHFADGPKRLPNSYCLLPNSELHRLGNVAYFHVDTLRRLDDRVLLDATDPRTGQTLFVYEFDLNLTPMRMRSTGAGLGLHQNFEAKGELDHGVAECPELAGNQVFRRWTEKQGWSEIEVPVASPNTLN